ncbi:hypothetical protein BUMB_05069c [Candidatus Paraburkholderia calva]|nr:hypothetical protein BUMB_05069c [Candidatus Paraburkholderia calva]
MLLPSLIALRLKLGSISYSTIETAWSIGALGISALLAVMKLGPGQPLGIDLLVIILMAAVLTLVLFAPDFVVLVAAHFGLGIGFAFVRVRLETRFLHECPIHLLGRFRANSMPLTSIVGLLIYFVPLVSGHASIAALYVSIAGAILLATLTLLVTSASVTSVKTRTISD